MTRLHQNDKNHQSNWKSDYEPVIIVQPQCAPVITAQ